MLFKKKNQISNQEENKVEENGIYVLGSGCNKCNSLENNVKQALDSLGIEEEIKHIRDFSIIASYGVMSTPALIIDNKLVSYGKVLDKEECINLIKKTRGL
ncbi:MAG: thioredoxin family protein [Peptoniphilaceae bacterium]